MNPGRRKLAAAGLALLGGAAIGSGAVRGGADVDSVAEAQGTGLRQTGSLTFTDRRPGRSSEVVLSTDYVNPDDPNR